MIAEAQDEGADAIAGAQSSKCIKVGEEIPLKWAMLGWHVTKRRWIKLDLFTTRAECEAGVRNDADVGLRAKCIPASNSKAGEKR